MSLASSNNRAIVSPAAILMLTSSLSSSRGSLGRCLKSRSRWFPNLAGGVALTKSGWALLAQDVFELAGRADGEQQRPGQQSVGVQLARLRGDGGTGPVRSGVGPGEQVLEALHRSLHVLKRGRGRQRPTP